MQDNQIELALYSDAELQNAVSELFGYQSFLEGMAAFLPPELNDLILEAKDKVNNVFDFQQTIIKPFLNMIESISISELTWSGLENLNANDRYLFISNHRDIGLDSAYLNLILFENGFKTSQIAIGDNLMTHRIAELLFRINKSFVVKRKGNPRELYEHSIRLSKYIHNLIAEKSDSVWIAQREGRAKDGNDITQPGILKMLSLANTGELKDHFKSLKIVPVSISYEYDPCGMLKTNEYINQLETEGYKKSFEKDLEQILLGIKGNKGKVHFHYGKPLDSELEIFDSLKKRNRQLDALASLIDQEIHHHYRLLPINYVACDLLLKNKDNQPHYSEEEFKHYKSYFQEQIASLKGNNIEAGYNYLLSMYANPVINSKLQLKPSANTQ